MRLRGIFFYSEDPKRNAIVQEYILPNFSDSRPGRVKAPDDILADADQVLVMNNERFTVPELLFRPTDIGSFRIRLSLRFSLFFFIVSELHTDSRAIPIRNFTNYRRFDLDIASGLARPFLGQHRPRRRECKISWASPASVRACCSPFNGYHNPIAVTHRCSYMPFMFAIFRADELRSLAPIHYEVQIYESSE